MFENLFTDMMKEGGPVPKIKRQEVRLLDNPLIYPSIYRSKLVDIDNMDDKELFSVISDCIQYIIDSIENGENDYEDIKYFQNRKFLNTLINVVARRQIDIGLIMSLNKIASQYMTSSSQRNLELVDEMTELIKVCNRNYIAQMVSLTGISEEHALNISAAFLSGGDSGGIRSLFRLNCEILRLPKEKVTEQNVIFIYETFSNELRLSNLFKSLLFDYGLPIENEKDNEKLSTMILGVLNMLNSQKYSTIRSVLIEYVNSYNYPSTACKAIRFSIYSLAPSDFERIIYTAQELVNEGIIVP